MRETTKDTIEISVRNQLEAFAQMGATTFKVQCVPDAALRGKPRLVGPGDLQPWKPWKWREEDVLRHLSLLKRRNLEGFNIFIAPLPDDGGNHAPLVFIDDILPEALRRMRTDCLQPAILIESSPGKFQGWVALNLPGLMENEIRCIQRQLIDRYGLDVGAVGAEQNGRLAGFRNVKVKYLKSMIFSKLVPVEPKKISLEVVFEARSITKPTCPTLHPGRLTSKSGARIRAETLQQSSTIDAFWLRKISSVSKPSESEREFSACLACLRRGFHIADVEQTLFKLGDNLASRKGSKDAVWDYVRRTVRKAAMIVQRG